MPRAFIALALSLLCLVAAPRAALAERVLLVRPAASDNTLSEAFNRLRAELLLQDFEVEVLDSAQLSPEQLETAAQRANAFAGIALNRHASGANADVSIADRVTGKLSVRRVAITAGSDSPRILAVRAVDLLRASLRELPAGERPPPDVLGAAASPTPPSLRVFAEPRARFQLSAAAIVLGSAREVSNGYGAGLAFWYRPTTRLGVGALLVGPLVGARYRSTRGSAVLRQELGQLRASFNVLEPGPLELGPVLGAGVYHLRAQGEVTPPLASLAASLWSFAGSGGVEARLRLGQALSLGASVHALLLSPRPIVAVHTASEELGQPMVLASLGLGVAF